MFVAHGSDGLDFGFEASHEPSNAHEQPRWDAHHESGRQPQNLRQSMQWQGTREVLMQIRKLEAENATLKARLNNSAWGQLDQVMAENEARAQRSDEEMRGKIAERQQIILEMRNSQKKLLSDKKSQDALLSKIQIKLDEREKEIEGLKNHAREDANQIQLERKRLQDVLEQKAILEKSMREKDRTIMARDTEIAALRAQLDGPKILNWQPVTEPSSLADGPGTAETTDRRKNPSVPEDLQTWANPATSPTTDTSSISEDNIPYPPVAGTDLGAWDLHQKKVEELQLKISQAKQQIRESLRDSLARSEDQEGESSTSNAIQHSFDEGPMQPKQQAPQGPGSMQVSIPLNLLPASKMPSDHGKELGSIFPPDLRVVDNDLQSIDFVPVQEQEGVVL
mmetsp:Transcript_5212/g.10484  ORF Transcript_5212/g.10484 Transcript_5212/m.10484 type:complete len:395 (-) Transcript_5212:160-1344(-)|eukprot:CAMPEP_0181315338 /NCGR_PEP_ID=MMETSP1101-20121128/15321_1 /TAXON_ID=46948 /ORGANISM="Rhodomonas abbreviata, Strain Caron Lab Isolate" /LENGTH=394 /DNA_ID=CAMNT_0023422537 /DNA_START=184 /DNA_END=1368 /DNA_ORIENTATION=+